MNHLKKLAIVVLIFTVGNLSAQSLDKWSAMKTFQEVMARAYHPVEEGNLTSVKAFSQTLADKAMELSTKEVPKEIKTEALMKKVTLLQLKAQEVNKLVKSNASDEALKKSITETNDIFHSIVAMSMDTKK